MDNVASIQSMFPLRCIVQRVSEAECISCASIERNETLIDTFTIIPGGTQLDDLVETVLHALGYNKLVPYSKGKIRINNWKPLAFDQITDNLQCPVDVLLKDLSPQVTLLILTKLVKRMKNRQ
jgi:hypothetical protein